MPVGVLIEIPGCTLEQYRAVIAQVGLAPPQPRPPEGMLLHVGGAMDGGWRVFDVWESREPYERFVAQHVGPALAAAGVAPFTPRVFDLDNFVTT